MKILSVRKVNFPIDVNIWETRTRVVYRDDKGRQKIKLFNGDLTIQDVRARLILEG